MAQPLLILGAGLFAEEVADLASQTAGCEVIGFIEGLDKERCAQRLHGLPVWWIDHFQRDVQSHAPQVLGVCAVGSPQRADFIRLATAQGLRFTRLVHPAAVVSPSAELGEGCVVFAGAVIAAHCRLGRHVIVNRGALLGHHLQIGDYVTIGPGANLGGKSRIAEGCQIGIGAILVDGIDVGRGAFISAGSVVSKDIPEMVQVAGVPAQVLRRL